MLFRAIPLPPPRRPALFFLHTHIFFYYCIVHSIFQRLLYGHARTFNCEERRRQLTKWKSYDTAWIALGSEMCLWDRHTSFRLLCPVKSIFFFVCSDIEKHREDETCTTIVVDCFQRFSDCYGARKYPEYLRYDTGTQYYET